MSKRDEGSVENSEHNSLMNYNSQAYGHDFVQENVKRYIKQFERGKEKSEREAKRKERIRNVTDISNNFYTLVTDFYEYGYGRSFHFAPVLSASSSLQECVLAYEREIARTIKANQGMKLLDAGCGVGGPMINIAKFTGAHVVGLNPCEYQLKRVKFHIENNNMQECCIGVKGDFHHMEFGDNTFDGGYALESTLYATDPEIVYREIRRVLKPGAIFVDSAWAMTEAFDPKNAEHVKIKEGIEIGNGIPDLRTQLVLLEAIRKSGLEIVEYKNAHCDGELPWYTFLVGKHAFSLDAFRVSSVGRKLTHFMLSAMEMLRIVPQGSTDVHNVLLTAADALIQGGRKDIFTPMFRLVLRKPL